jgi:hypothetical protein
MARFFIVVGPAALWDNFHRLLPRALMMPMKPFSSVDEVMGAVVKLRDALHSSGHIEAANALNRSLNTYYTTATEALGELRNTLHTTKSVWSMDLSQGYKALGEHTLKEIARMINLQ